MVTPSSFSVNAWRSLTLWFRNNWASWIAESNRAAEKPNLRQIATAAGTSAVAANIRRRKKGQSASKESGSSSLRVKVASTSDARLSSNVGNTTAALKKSRHLFQVEISGPFYNKTRCAIESMQAAEEEDARGTVQPRCAYRPARRQDQFSTERDDLCRNFYNEQRCRMPR
jgi:hypothetical protein